MGEKTAQRKEGLTLYRRTMAVRTFVYLLPALGACTLVEPPLADVEQPIIVGRCTEPDFCGTNSPLISRYSAWEFKLDGTPNDQDFALLGLGKDYGSYTEFYTLQVQDSRISGADAWGDRVLVDSDLIDAKIYFQHRGRQHAIAITNVGQIYEVVTGGLPIQTYVLDWSDVTAQPLPFAMPAGYVIESSSLPLLSPPAAVCPPPKWIYQSYVGSMVEWDESTYAGMGLYESIVFEGDRFDPETRTVAHTADNNWFNIACGTTTLAKLRLTRNTIQTANWRNVQAAFKNLSADYCGTGTAFTFPGEPLVWRDRNGMEYFHLGSKNDLEARWNENGAMCMNSPRLLRSGNPAVAATYTDVWEAIKLDCDAAGKQLQQCNDLDPINWEMSDELVTSANYD
jgi:hypothetical protein